jgi:hypothetical protein
VEAGVTSATSTRTPARRVLLAYARPYWLALVGGGLLSLTTAATGLALPLVVRELIDTLGAGRTVADLLVLMTSGRMSRWPRQGGLMPSPPRSGVASGAEFLDGSLGVLPAGER